MACGIKVEFMEKLGMEKNWWSAVCTVSLYLQSTVLVAGNLMIAVTVTVERSEHDTERSSPLTEKDEEMMAQRLLREEKTPVVDWTIREREKKKTKTG